MNAKMLPTNVHTLERAARVGLGLLGVTLFFTGPATPWGLLGLVPLATGLIGSCPLYTLLGVSTCSVKRT